MAVHSDVYPVAVLNFGENSATRNSIIEALSPHAAGIDLTNPPRGSPPTDSAIHGETNVETVILVIDRGTIGSLFTERPTCAARTRRRVQGGRICDLGVEHALFLGARRVAVVGDARGLTFGGRARAVRWVRDLARGIAYEGSINGAHPLAASYALIDTAGDVGRIAEAALTDSVGTCV